MSKQLFFLEKFKSLFFMMLALGVFLSGCGKLDLPEELKADIASEGLIRLEANIPASAVLNQCVPMILSLASANGQAIAAKNDLNVLIAGAGANELFTDSACLVQAPSSVPWLKDQSGKALFFKPSITQLYTLQISESLQNAIGVFKIVQVTTTSQVNEELKLAIIGPNSFQSGLCKSFTVALQTLSGASRTRSAPTTLQMGGAGTGSLYAGTNCSGAPVTSLTLPAGVSFASFSFRGPTAENLLLTVDASVAGIGSAFHTIEVQSGAAYMPQSLAMSGVSSITAGACSAPVQVRTLDSLGQSAVNAAALSLSLSGNLGFQAYADAGCLTPLLAPQIPAGGSAMNFYFQVSSAGNLIITAADPGPLLDASLAVSATSTMGGSATRLAVTGPTSVTAGTCSSSYLVKTQDNSHVDYPVVGSVTVQLTGKGSGDFYSDASCSTPISSVIFSSGDSIKAFYYRSAVPGVVVFNADDSGPLLPGSQSVNIAPAAPTSLTLSGAGAIGLGECRAYLAQSRDSGGNASAVASATPLDLMTNSSGHFYIDASCLNPTTSVSILSGQSTAIFYYKPSLPGAATLTVDDLGAMTAGTLPLTVNDLPPTRLALSRPSLTVGLCTPVTISLKNVLGTAAPAVSLTTVNLSGVGSGSFYSNASCANGSESTAAAIAATQSDVTLYFKDLITESLNLSAQATGLVGDNWAITVQAAAAHELRLSGPAQKGAGACVALALTARDAHGNLSPLTVSALVTLSGAGSGRFSTQSDCASATGSLTLPVGFSSQALYYQNNNSESVNLEAASAGLVTASHALNIQSGGATKIKWTLAAQKNAGSCITGVLQVQDSLNNPVSQTAARVLQLQDFGAAEFYTSADCSGAAVTSLTVPISQHSVSFSMKDTVAQSLNLQATSAGLSAALHSFQVLPGAPQRLALNGLAALLAGECSSYDLRSEDSHGNLSPAVTNTSVNLTGYSQARVYADAACLSAIGSTLLASGASQKTVYIRGQVAESLNVQASASGLVSASRAITIQPLPAVALALTGAASGAAGSCHAVTVRVRDAHGNAVLQGAARSLDLLGAGHGVYYSDAACSTALTQVTIAAGSAQQSFYFRSQVAESVQLTARDAASELADAQMPFVVQALAPASLTLAGGAALNAGACVAYTVGILDSLGNWTGPGVNKSIALTGAGGAGAFFQDAGCLNSLSSLAFNAAQTMGTFYYKATAAQSVNLHVDDVGLPDLTAATLAVTVNAPSGGGESATVRGLRITGVGGVSTGSCYPYAVQTVDASGNSFTLTDALPIGLAGAGAGSFHLDSACATAAVTSVTVAAGSAFQFFYFQTATAQSLIFIASATGTGITTLPVTVSSSTSTPVAIKISGLASIQTSTCTPYTATAMGSSGYSHPVSTNTTVNLSLAGSGLIFSDANCSNSVNSVQIPAGSSSANIYYRSAVGGSAMITAGATGLAQDSFAVSVVNPNGNDGGSSLTPTKLRLSGAGSVLTNACSGPFHVSVRDSNDREAPLMAAASIGFSLTSLNAQIYSDSSCATSINSFLMNSGESIKSFYLKTERAESLVLDASTSSLLSASLNIQVMHSALLQISGGPSQGIWRAFYRTGISGVEQSMVSVSNIGQTQALNIQPQGALASGFSYVGGVFPGLGGSCSPGGSLAPGSRCTMNVRFDASAASNFSSILSLNYEDGAMTRVASMVLNGRGGEFFGVRQVATGDDHSCFLRTDMTVKCFGDNSRGQLGIGSTENIGQAYASTDFAETTPIASQALQITAGAAHTCILNANGEVFCWGLNQHGQLGIGSTQDIGHLPQHRVAPFQSVSLGAGRKAVQISAGGNHTCALLDNLSLKCWGLNASGQLGYGDTNNRGVSAAQMGSSLPSIDLGSGLTPVSVAAGGNHSCALFSNGSIKCWGANSYGQLGIGENGQRGHVPGTMGAALMTADLGGKAHSLVAGREHNCAIVTSATGAGDAIKCWGSNQSGQLGIGNGVVSRGLSPLEMGSNLPSISLMGRSPTAIFAGNTHSCALIDQGALHCWGSNGSGQLGIDTTSSLAIPQASVQISSSRYAMQVALGKNHSCAVLQDATSKCWGSNSRGQLALRHGTDLAPVWGTGGFKRRMIELPPNKAGTFSFLKDLSFSAEGQSCAVWRSGDISCWGIYGSLGAASPNYSYGSGSRVGSPFFLKEKAKRIFFVDGSDANAFCFLLDSNEVACWGTNASGKTAPISLYSAKTPQSPGTFFLPGNREPVKMASHESGACFLATDQSVWCSGLHNAANMPFSNLGTAVSQSTYTQLIFSEGVVDFDLSAKHGCAILVSGKILCWGKYTSSQATGVNLNTAAGVVSTPNQFIPPSPAVEVALGDAHACARLQSGQVACWGRNETAYASGAVGNGNNVVNEIVSSPLILNLGSGFIATQIVTGGKFSCALSSQGRVKCWGNIGIGDGSSTRGGAPNQMGDNLPPVVFPAGFKADVIYAKHKTSTACAKGLLNDDPLQERVYCWGNNSKAQLGNGSVSPLALDSAGFGSLRPVNHTIVGFVDDHVSDYRIPGSYTYTVPNGISRILVQIWGAGAAGFFNNSNNGGGGAGGGYVSQVLEVSSEQTYAFTVGAGAKTSNTSTAAGGSSSFAGMIAYGGGAPSSTDAAGGSGVGGSGGDIVEAGESGKGGSFNTNLVTKYYDGGLGGSTFLGGLGGEIGASGEFPGGGGSPLYATAGSAGADGRVLISSLDAFVDTSAMGPVYSRPGSYIYRVPQGVSMLRVQIWGGGGGGGCSPSSSYRGAGGGAGGYTEEVFKVSHGDVIGAFIGRGGAGLIASSLISYAGYGESSSATFEGKTVFAGGGGGGFTTNSASDLCGTGGSSPGYCRGGLSSGGFTLQPGESGTYAPNGIGGSAYSGGHGGSIGQDGGFPGGGGGGGFGNACTRPAKGGDGQVVFSPL